MGKLSKKLIAIMLVAGLTAIMLTGCGSPKPADTVKDFLTSIQSADYKKAMSYVDTKSDSDLSALNESKDGLDGKEILKAIAKNYKFENPKEVSNKDGKAKVKVKITSVDMQVVFTQTMNDVMPMAFAGAFNENEEEADKTMEKLMSSTLMKNLKSKDATMATRDVTLNLKKDKDGEFKIVSDDNLLEAVMANSKEIDKMFGEKK